MIFDFSGLIKEHYSEFTAVIPSKGHYDSKGDYIREAEQQISLQGAIIEHRKSKVYRSEGTITQQDMALYMLEPLEKALYGAKVSYEGNTYQIGDELSNGKFTGVWHYNLKYVSAFDKEGGNND